MIKMPCHCQRFRNISQIKSNDINGNANNTQSYLYIVERNFDFKSLQQGNTILDLIPIASKSVNQPNFPVFNLSIKLFTPSGKLVSL